MQGNTVLMAPQGHSVNLLSFQMALASQEVDLRRGWRREGKDCSPRQGKFPTMGLSLNLQSLNNRYGIGGETIQKRKENLNCTLKIHDFSYLHIANPKQIIFRDIKKKKKNLTKLLTSLVAGLCTSTNSVALLSTNWPSIKSLVTAGDALQLL